MGPTLRSRWPRGAATSPGGAGSPVFAPHWAPMRRRAQWFWWTSATVGVLVTLGSGTWWLWTMETRGAEIANVLALPVAVLGLVAAVGAIAVAVRLAGRGDGELTGAGRPRDAPAPRSTNDVDRPLCPEQLGDQPKENASEAVSPGARAMTKELFFLAGHPAPLHDAAAELRRTGFLIRRQPHDLGGTWSLVAYSATSELNKSDMATLEEIAESCGVEFDGWGTYVGPPELDGGPGKAPTRR